MSIEDLRMKADKLEGEALKGFYKLDEAMQKKLLADEEKKLIPTETTIYPPGSPKRKALLQRRAAMRYAEEKYNREHLRQAAE